MKLGTVMNLISVPEGADPYKYRIEKTAELGLKVLGVFFVNADSWKDRAYLTSLGELAQQRGIELRMGTGGNFYLEGAEGDAEVARVAEMIQTIAGPTGIRFSSLASGPMLTTHRWAPGKPLEERKAILAANLGKLADAVAGAGITLGVENHCDWRGHEIAEIVQRANRPNLRVQIDTGNAFSVFEEPVDCARALAPYVVSCHLKDIHVTPFAPAPCRGSRAVAVPLGEGHVDNVTICQILQEKAPDPASIGLMIEPFYLPEEITPDEFLSRSVAWARQHLAPFLD